MTPLIRLATIATAPIAFLVALSQLLTAESRPGDGFTAGIISSLGLTLQYLSFGRPRARTLLRQPNFPRIFGLGLGLAVLAGILPLVFGAPFLGSVRLAVPLPLLGDLILSRSLLFDIAIYLVVLGGAMTIIDSLGRVPQ